MTILRCGDFPAPFADHEAASMAAGNGDTIRAVTAKTYAGQTIDVSALTGITVDDVVDGRYTIGLDTTAVYAMNLGDGFSMVGGTIKAAANRAIYVDAVGAYMDVDFYVEAGGAASMVWLANAGVLTMPRCRVRGDTHSTPEIFVTFTDSEVHLGDVCVDPNITLTLGMVYVYNGTSASITLNACGSPSGNLIRVRAGATITNLDIYGSYAPHLVDDDGTITAYAGDYNAYSTTDAGTENATFQDGGIADFQLDDRGYPLPTSPLFRAIHAGVQYGAGLDADGNPRQADGRQDIGPLQTQHDPRWDAILAGVYS